ncbi:MAG: hypothetical protein SF070_03675 [Gemmatimonadota bacterium]|nr:hypothetical protein [Gemmatimonadota bacterium]
MRTQLTLALLLTTLGQTLACQNSSGPGFTPNLDIAICQPTAGNLSSNITHPFFPMTVGRQWTLEGDDQGQAVVLQITALPDTELVAGIYVRVLEERETVGGALLEVSRNFFVQTGDGTVCYYGEDVDIYDNGVIVSHDGAWRAGVSGATPGIFMPAAPAVGQAFEQEVAPGIAQDRVTIKAVGETTVVPLGSYSNTIRFTETTPLEPGAKSTKVYAGGVGPLVDDIVRLTSVTP